jgi:lipopolysaccharide/colanic/teichoic acid biosynthesis glycosyltransferase
MLKRLFDIVCATTGILILSPFLLLISLLVAVTSRGGVFYFQERVGRNNTDFKVYKFRTMYPGADKKGLLTVGGKDTRITPVGYYLRKYKLDELPQLFNVLFGSMSLVGPRPEVRRYVNSYTQEQMQVLDVKPGITDYASLEYFDENELLAKSDDVEKTYIEEIMPAKLALNKRYISEQSMKTDLTIIWKTIKRIIMKSK